MIVYKIRLVLWYSLAIFFNAVMDCVHFYPDSWLVQLAPDFMQIKDCAGWLPCIDGWHVSKQLMFGCLFICVVNLLKMGWMLPYDKFNLKFYLRLAIIMAILSIIVHEIFLKLIF